MIYVVYLFSFILPITYAIMGYVFWKNTPKLNGNKSGWRTSTSTKSEETWKVANEVGGRGLLILGISEFIITLIIHIFIANMNLFYFVFISAVVIVLQSISFTNLHKYVDKKLSSL